MNRLLSTILASGILFCSYAAAMAHDHRPVPLAYDRFHLPLKKLSVTSSFGYRIHPFTRKYAFHAGIDLRADRDTVFAVLSGKVKAGYSYFLGIYIQVNEGGLQMAYGHLSRILVVDGETVRTGMPIGITGMTGRTTGEHLHFAVKFRQVYINPLRFLTLLMNRSPGPK